MTKRLFYTALISLVAIGNAIAADVDGEWSVAMNSAEGGTVIPMTISIDGEMAKAMVGQDELSGTYRDGELKLTGPLYVPEAGMSATLDMTAKLDGDHLKGTANWDMYTANVLGTRKD